MRPLPVVLIAFSIAVALGQPPASNELALKMEARAEAAADYEVLRTTIKDNANERLVVQAFCQTQTAEPARTVRINYCTAKYKLFDNRDFDLRAQAAKLQGAVQKLDQEIALLRRNGAK